MSLIDIAHSCAVQVADEKNSAAILRLLDEFRHHLAESVSLPVVGCVDYDSALMCPESAVMLVDKRFFVDGTIHYVCEGSSVYRLQLSPSQFRVTANATADEYALPMLVQTLLNFYMPQFGLLFLHASAFCLGDKVHAIHGFGGAGKTETMVCALQREALFLADDLAIFNERGELFPYLRKVGLHDYPFTEEQLAQLGLNKWLFALWRKSSKGRNRLWRYLSRRLRSKFNIAVDYLALTSGKITPPIGTLSTTTIGWMQMAA